MRILAVSELSGNLSSFQVVDARRRAEFERGHIPGSVWMPWEDRCRRPPRTAGKVLHQPGYWGLLEESEARQARRLYELGIEVSEPIVVYADGPTSRGREGRIARMLYFGASNVGLLDGGWTAWKDARASNNAYRKADPKGRVSKLQKQGHRRVRRGRLVLDVARSDGPLLIDTRTLDEFLGNGQHYLRRRGHVPNSVFLPYTELFRSDGRYVSKEKYWELLASHGLIRKQCVSYCEVGVRASLHAMIHEAYTGEIMPVYDGSFVEWASQPNLPVSGLQSGRSA